MDPVQVAPESLHAIDALSGCSEDDRKLLAPNAQRLSFVDGQVVFKEGEHHGRLYFVLQGTVHLDMQTAKYGRQTILSTSQGELLAWSSLVGDGLMTATATVTQPTDLIAFDASTLRKLLDDHPVLGFRFMTCVAQALSRRLLATRLQMLDLYNR